MGKASRDYAGGLDIVAIGRRLGTEDLFIYRIYEHGGCIVKAFVEAVYSQISLVEWVDFLVDEPIISRNVSILGKRVFRDIYKARPIPILYIILFYDSCGVFKEVLSRIKNIKITTTQWYSWYVKPIYGAGPLHDLIYTYSEHLPSRYKPIFRTLDIPRYPYGLIYYNDFSSIRYRFRDLPQPPTEEDSIILYPPNYFGVGGDANNYLFMEYRYEYRPLEYSSVVRKYTFLLNTLWKFDQTGIFPIMMERDGFIECGFIEVCRDGIKFRSGCILDLDDFIIDLSHSLWSGKRFIVYFKDFWSKLFKKGYSIPINIGFIEFKPTPSHIFLELRYGGKVYYSTSSRVGYKVFNSL